MDAEKKLARSVKRQIAAADKAKLEEEGHVEAETFDWKGKTIEIVRKEWMYPAVASSLAVPLMRSILVFPVVWAGYFVSVWGRVLLDPKSSIPPTL